MIHRFNTKHRLVKPRLILLFTLTMVVGVFSSQPAGAFSRSVVFSSRERASAAVSHPVLNIHYRNFSTIKALSQNLNIKRRSPPINPPIRYHAQPGDTLQSVAAHFGVDPVEIISPAALPGQELLAPGQLLSLPPRINDMRLNFVSIDANQLIPDGEVVYGPSAAGFNVQQYLQQTGGYLADHREYLGSTSWTSAADVVTRVALENSINPRLLLALMEYECGCVLGDSQGKLGEGYVLGIEQYEHQWLYGQLGWAVNELSKGYYGWRSGSLTEITLPNGIILRPSPESNAGSVALVHYFASLAAQKTVQKIPAKQRILMESIPVDDSWEKAVDPNKGFPALYKRMYPGLLDTEQEPLFTAGVNPPELELPFEPGFVWSFTSGPHKAWQTEGALAALDFAPSSKRTGCTPSGAWVVAAADGPVVRTGEGYIIQSLDDPGVMKKDASSNHNEFSGWALLYMHLRVENKAPEGTYLKAGDPVGHPSCEGGPTTGTHLHFARKYNGEWIAADGPLPMVLSGWRVQAGEQPYQGTLTKDDQIVYAHPWGSFDTLVWVPGEGTLVDPVFDKYEDLRAKDDDHDTFGER